MILHADLGSAPEERRKRVRLLLRSKRIGFGGYKKNKIYGLLTCKSGMGMKIENRVFFKDEKEAINHGYRPCGACLPAKYKLWKEGKDYAGGS